VKVQQLKALTHRQKDIVGNWILAPNICQNKTEQESRIKHLNRSTGHLHSTMTSSLTITHHNKNVHLTDEIYVGTDTVQGSGDT
jgi:hypothetical protein